MTLAFVLAGAAFVITFLALDAPPAALDDSSDDVSHGDWPFIPHDRSDNL